MYISLINTNLYKATYRQFVDTLHANFQTKLSLFYSISLFMHFINTKFRMPFQFQLSFCYDSLKFIPLIRLIRRTPLINCRITPINSRLISLTAPARYTTSPLHFSVVVAFLGCEALGRKHIDSSALIFFTLILHFLVLQMVNSCPSLYSSYLIFIMPAALHYFDISTYFIIL
jgi:hypothetical protein